MRLDNEFGLKCELWRSFGRSGTQESRVNLTVYACSLHRLWFVNVSNPVCGFTRQPSKCGVGIGHIYWPMSSGVEAISTQVRMKRNGWLLRDWHNHNSRTIGTAYCS